MSLLDFIPYGSKMSECYSLLFKPVLNPIREPQPLPDFNSRMLAHRDPRIFVSQLHGKKGYITREDLDQRVEKAFATNYSK